MKIDKRKAYYIVIDTETTGLQNPLVYDIGYTVIDKKGTIYHSESMIIPEIFIFQSERMKTAYYAEKIPYYLWRINNGHSKFRSFKGARRRILKSAEKYNVKAIIAHNMSFDYRALNYTANFLSNGTEPYFFPKNTELWCTLSMAKSIMPKKVSYVRFCERNELLKKNGEPRLTAEALYRFLIDEPNFIEDHTGLEDAKIEGELFSYFLRQKKAMERNPWAV